MKSDLIENANGSGPLTTEERLRRTSCIVEIGSPVAEEIPRDGVCERGLFQSLKEGEYDAGLEEEKRPADELEEKGLLTKRESLPEGQGRKSSAPWFGYKLEFWCDRHTYLFGPLARGAFEDTREESLRRAALKRSPYRQAGLSEPVAQAAERRRIEKEKAEDLPRLSLAGVLSGRSRQRQLLPLGLLPPNTHRDNDRWLLVLEDMREEKGRLVDAKKFLWVLDRVKSQWVLAQKRGRIEVVGRSSRRSPVEIKIRGKASGVGPDLKEVVQRVLYGDEWPDQDRHVGPLENVHGGIMPLSTPVCDLLSRVPEQVRQRALKQWKNAEERDTEGRRRRPPTTSQRKGTTGNQGSLF